MTQSTFERCTDKLCSDCQSSLGKKCTSCIVGYDLNEDKVCETQNVLSLKFIKLKKEKSKVILKFNGKLALRDHFEDQLNITLTDNGQPANFEVLSIKSPSSSKKKLNIFLKFNQPLNNALLTIKPFDSLLGTKEADFILTSEYSSELVRQVFKFDPDIRLSNINVAQRNEAFEESLTLTGSVSSTASKTVVGALFLLNLPLALAVIKLLQFVEFFNLLSLEYPANLISFFNIFNGDLLEFIPNIFEKLEEKDEYVRTCRPEGKMDEEELSCSFLTNSGAFLSFFIFVLLIKVVILLIRLPFLQTSGKNLPKPLIKKSEDGKKEAQSHKKSIIHLTNLDQEHPPAKKGCLAKVLTRMSEYLGFCQFVLLMKMSLVDFMIPIAINLEFLKQFTKISTANLVISYGILLSYLILLIYGLVVIFRMKAPLHTKFRNKDTDLSKSERKKIARFKQWMGTRDNFEDNLVFPYKYLPELTSLGELLCCFFLIFGYKYFLVQIFPIIILKGLLVYWHFKNKHLYVERSEHTVNLVNEVIILLVSVVFLIYYFVSDVISPQARYNIFGNIMIAFFLLMMLFNLIVGIIAIIMSIKKRCTRSKNKKRLTFLQREKIDKGEAFTPDPPARSFTFLRNGHLIATRKAQNLKVMSEKLTNLKNKASVLKFKRTKGKNKKKISNNKLLKQPSIASKKLLSKHGLLKSKYHKVN